MKRKHLLGLIMVMVCVFSAFPVQASYMVEVGSVAFRNQSTFNDDGTIKTGGIIFNDDFNTTNIFPSRPISTYYSFSNPSLVNLTSTGKLAMTYAAPDTHVSLASYGYMNGAQTPFGTLSNAGYNVNFLSGAPLPGYGYGMGFRAFSADGSRIDDALLEVVTWNGKTYLSLSDETHSIVDKELQSGFTSIALGLRVDANGLVTAGYILNPADNILNTPYTWVPLEGGTTQLNQSLNHDVRFYTMGGIPSNVPVPAAVWLLGTGLVGLIGIRRRFAS